MQKEFTSVDDFKNYFAFNNWSVEKQSNGVWYSWERYGKRYCTIKLVRFRFIAEYRTAKY